LLSVWPCASAIACRTRSSDHRHFRSAHVSGRSKEKKSPIDRRGYLLEVRRDETREVGKKAAGILTEGKDPEQVSDECGTGFFECVRAVGCTDSTTYTMQTSSGAGGLFSVSVIPFVSLYFVCVPLFSFRRPWELSSLVRRKAL
jgi:hypothetical protein